MIGSTPLRSLPFTAAAGCRWLADREIHYRDGSEGRLFEVIGSASDLTTLSDELESYITSWPEQYHLSKSRADLLRPLELSETRSVLEVGCGCGALTRYLGEVGAVVDALEPVAERARIARRRTRDLDSVEVFVGGLEDVPVEPAYDLVLVVGVLEYVAAGAADPGPYVRFLERARNLLRPGGRVVCAIENRLGVKYLAAAPEDHSQRVYDGVEGYPRGTPARTFSRQELAELFLAAGMETRFFHAFGDYKLPRVLFSDAMFEAGEEERSLAWRIPRFPSPDRDLPRPRTIDERSLWRSLVESGLGPHFTNSFLVVATPAGVPEASPVWPSDLLACYFSSGRRSTFAVGTWLRDRGSGLRFERSRLAGSERRVEHGDLALVVSDDGFAPGRDLVEVMATADADAIATSLREWRALVESASGRERGASVDLVPHNLVVHERTGTRAIDLEWWVRGYGVEQILERGILWLAEALGERSVPERWPGDRVGDIVCSLGASVGLAADGSWLSRAMDREAAFQVQVFATSEADREAHLGRHREGLRGLVNRRLEDTPFGLRVHERLAHAEAELTERSSGGPDRGSGRGLRRWFGR